MMEYWKTFVFTLMVTVFGNIFAAEAPEVDLISIKGSNSFTGESINAVREGQSLELACVVRNISLGDILWLRDGVNLTYNQNVISMDDRYGIQFNETEKGRRFFRLSLRNISRGDSGKFTCTSLILDINSTVNIRVRWAPGSEYPMCSRDNASEIGNNLMRCSTERGVPTYTTRWFHNGISLNTSSGVATDISNGLFTSSISIGSDERANSTFECRLYLKSEEVFGRLCCIGGDGDCNPTTDLTSHFPDQTTSQTPSYTATSETSESSSQPPSTTGPRMNNKITKTLGTTNIETTPEITDGITSLLTTLIIDATERDDLGEKDQTPDPSDATTSLQVILNATNSNDVTTNGHHSSLLVTTTFGYPDESDGSESSSPGHVSTAQINMSSENVGILDDFNISRNNNEALSGVSSLNVALGTLILSLMCACMF